MPAASADDGGGLLAEIDLVNAFAVGRFVVVDEEVGL